MCTMWYLRLNKHNEVIERISLFDLCNMLGVSDDIKRLDQKLYMYNLQQTDGTCIVEHGKEIEETERKYVKRKGLLRLDTEGKVIEVYKDAKEAAKKLGVSRQYIMNCLYGKRRNKYNLRWREEHGKN